MYIYIYTYIYIHVHKIIYIYIYTCIDIGTFSGIGGTCLSRLQGPDVQWVKHLFGMRGPGHPGHPGHLDIQPGGWLLRAYISIYI